MDQIVKEQKMRALQQLLLQVLPYAWCVNNYPKLKENVHQLLPGGSSCHVISFNIQTY